MEPLLDVRDLSVEFAAPTGAVTAVHDVSFALAAGEVLGLVGESGSGKSVTSLALLQLLPPQAGVGGQALFDGRDLLALDAKQIRQIRGNRIAMIFQEPMTALNPVMRVGDQIAEAVQAHHPGIRKREAWDRSVEALREVALPEPGKRAHDYPHQLSGGMRQRVMIAMALVNHPRLLIADEPTTALDVTIQAQILDLLAELQRKFELAMLFISHDLAVVGQVAGRVAVMYAGRIVETGPVRQVFQRPMHPYTRGLMQAVPSLETDRSRPLATVEGTVPPIDKLPAGCAFGPRCDLHEAACDVAVPPLVEVENGHWARCIVTPR